MPDKARFMAHRRREQRFNRMNLIWMEHHQRFIVLILTDDRVVRNQAVRIGDVQDLFNELIQIVDFLVVGCPPAEDELPMHVLRQRIGKVTCRLFVRNNEQLQCRKDVVSEQAFFRVFLDLMMRLKDTVLRRDFFQLDLNDW